MVEDVEKLFLHKTQKFQVIFHNKNDNKIIDKRKKKVKNILFRS